MKHFVVADFWLKYNSEYMLLPMVVSAYEPKGVQTIQFGLDCVMIRVLGEGTPTQLTEKWGPVVKGYEIAFHLVAAGSSIQDGEEYVGATQNDAGKTFGIYLRRM